MNQLYISCIVYAVLDELFVRIILFTDDITGLRKVQCRTRCLTDREFLSSSDPPGGDAVHIRRLLRRAGPSQE